MKLFVEKLIFEHLIIVAKSIPHLWKKSIFPLKYSLLIVQILIHFQKLPSNSGKLPPTLKAKEYP